MNNADNLHTSQPAAPPSDRNGPGTLSDRVRSLRLSERPARGGSKLPWVLCLVLLGSTVAFGFQAFKQKATGDQAADQKDKPAKPAVDPKVAESGDVVLESKGYIMAKQTIQISPRVGGVVEK